MAKETTKLAGRVSALGSDDLSSKVTATIMTDETSSVSLYVRSAATDRAGRKADLIEHLDAARAAVEALPE